MRQIDTISNALNELSTEACSSGALAFAAGLVDAATDQIAIVDACRRIRHELALIEEMTRLPFEMPRIPHARPVMKAGEILAIVASNSAAGKESVEAPTRSYFPDPLVFGGVEAEASASTVVRVEKPRAAKPLAFGGMEAPKRSYFPDRMPRRGRTPEEAFVQPILRVLAAAGGRASVDDVRANIPASMDLMDEDFLPIPSGGDVRWHTTISWTASALRKEGVLHSPKRGTWELTELGRERAAQCSGT